jgi:rRNA 2'-O-methyltransferase fibrillarin
MRFINYLIIQIIFNIHII